MKDSAPLGVLVLHHNGSSKNVDLELPKNYDIVGRKSCWRQIDRVWPKCLYSNYPDNCSKAAKVAGMMNEIYGYKYVAVGSGDFYRDPDSKFEGFLGYVKDALEAAYEKKFAVVYFSPNEKLHVITSKTDCDKLTKDEFLEKILYKNENWMFVPVPENGV